MAACDPQTLATDAKCLATGLSTHQLLAAIAYFMAIDAGESPTPANLARLGKCLNGLGDRQLLAIIAGLQCEAAQPT